MKMLIDTMHNQTIVNCPCCNKQVLWVAENTTKPFCSERCKLTDLGEWASETRAIPGEQVNPEYILQNDNELF